MIIHEILEQETTDFKRLIEWYFSNFDYIPTEEKKERLYSVISNLDDAMEWASYFYYEAMQRIIKFVKDSDDAVKFAKRFPLHRDLVSDLVRTPKAAYEWAFQYPEDRVKMRHMMIDDRYVIMDEDSASPYMIKWAQQFPEDQEILIDRIQNGRTAYFWGRDIGYDERLVQQIGESKYAHAWAVLYPQDSEVMMPLVTDERTAHKWALDIGNRDVMIKLIHSEQRMVMWAIKFPEDRDHMLSKIKSSEGALFWMGAYYNPVVVSKGVKARHEDIDNLEKDAAVLKGLIKTPEAAIEWCRLMPGDFQHFTDLIKKASRSSPELFLDFSISNEMPDILRGKEVKNYPRLSKLFC